MLYDPTERRIRSFVTRAGRLSTGQARALEAFGPRYLIEYRKAEFDFHAPFGRTAPLILEIGFGMGDTTAHIAKAMPDKDFIGVEVHTPGVGSLLKLAGEQDIANLRIIQHDAVEVLNNMIADGTLSGVHIFFPDPWHKTKHHKRRIIQPELVALLRSRLVVGGTLHCATDWEPYAAEMLQVLTADPGLENAFDGFAPRPESRPETKFERRGLNLGHTVRDVIVRRVR